MGGCSWLEAGEPLKTLLITSLIRYQLCFSMVNNLTTRARGCCDNDPVLGRASRPPISLDNNVSPWSCGNQHFWSTRLGQCRSRSEYYQSCCDCRFLVSCLNFSNATSLLTISHRILGVLLDVGLGFRGESIGVRLWYEPGAVNNGWWGFCSVMVTAAFAYSGSEMVGLTAAEQTNPRRDMPKAIRKVFLRIGIVSFMYCRGQYNKNSPPTSFTLHQSL